MAGTLKEQAQKFLPKVPEEYVFRCQDGRVLRDMNELAEALSTMADETFAYHANEAKNDFSNWVRDVIGDEELSLDLQNCNSLTEAAKIVASRITWLKNRK